MTENLLRPAHEPYITAVADAVDRAGMSVVEWSAEEGDPRAGWIEFALKTTVRAYGRDEVALLWNEEQGWSVGWGDANGRGRLERTVRMYSGVMPTVDEMVAAAREIVTELPGPDHGFPASRYRECGDEDGFDGQLAAYRAQLDISMTAPSEAYSDVPTVLREMNTILAMASAVPVGEDPGREYWLRKAVLADRIALQESALYAPDVSAEANRAANTAAMRLADYDRAHGATAGAHGPAAGLRPYVRQEYAAWLPTTF
ncbi:DUF6292 family protein [Streptomyces cucumeris]|uniref:DUF6292 family protein n=1 Tax=Streptomyces cucumeris TaxID=2962890 RepID=UPI003D73772C